MPLVPTATSLIPQLPLTVAALRLYQLAALTPYGPNIEEDKNVFEPACIAERMFTDEDKCTKQM